MSNWCAGSITNESFMILMLISQTTIFSPHSLIRCILKLHGPIMSRVTSHERRRSVMLYLNPDLVKPAQSTPDETFPGKLPLHLPAPLPPLCLLPRVVAFPPRSSSSVQQGSHSNARRRAAGHRPTAKQAFLGAHWPPRRPGLAAIGWPALPGCWCLLR